jgi:integrase/recombinase XerD
MKQISLQEYLKEYYTIKTVAVYSADIENYKANTANADTAEHKDIVHYIGKLRKRYSNAKTVSRILSSIKAYYSFLSHSGQRNDNPAQSIRLRDKQNRDIQLQDLFTEKELESLTEREERYVLLASRNKVLIGLLIYQGLLPTELENLKINDINLNEGTVYTKGAAKTNARTLKLKTIQIMVLHEYLTEIRPQLIKDSMNQFLLIGSRGEQMKGEDVTKHIKRTFKGRFKDRKVNCQSIRQSVITNLLKAGNDLRIVQVFAGHKNPSTTEKYKQSDTEALKTAIERFHPMR